MASRSLVFAPFAAGSLLAGAASALWVQADYSGLGSRRVEVDSAPAVGLAPSR